MTDEVGPVFAALADPTRRWMVEAFLREDSASAPELTSALPITRQAVAKHLATLSAAGIIEREPGARRPVRYRLREGALVPASSWLRDAEAAWEDRLLRLRDAVQRGKTSAQR